VGVRSHENGRCLSHLAPDELATALAAIEGDRKVDARGIEISSELLERILDALTQASHGHPRFKHADLRGAGFKVDARFTGATFEAEADFGGATFEANARFDGATFEGEADFGRATFEPDAEFRGATFKADAWFRGATFKANARFDGATFEAEADFGRATFEAEADFDRATLKGYARFGGATFEADAYFRRATFKGDAGFTGATFEGYAGFDGATFEAGFAAGATFKTNAEFSRVIFELARTFGPTVVLGTLNLEEASFLQFADLGVSANRLSLAKTRFPQGGQMRVRWAETVLDDAEFGAPSILCSSPQFGGFDEAELEQSLTEASDKRSERPHILSVRRANVGNLLLSDVELPRCRFERARKLDGLRLEGATFARSPRGAWAQRKVLSEEHQWRAKHGWRRRRPGWYTKEVRPPSWFCRDHPEVEKELDEQSIAAIYRALRKGQEDKKDEPGAADFYYGEMEMRKFDKTKPGAERLILWLYWLVSGYGLRASRALLSLLVTILLFAALLLAWGFPSQQSFLDALTFSAKSTTSLFRAPDQPLTTAGEWLNMALRLLGPLFFGLALLSLRGRVKR
jgi:hypothetical protein